MVSSDESRRCLSLVDGAGRERDTDDAVVPSAISSATELSESLEERVVVRPAPVRDLMVVDSPPDLKHINNIKN